MQFETPARPAARTPSRRQVVTVAALGTVGAGALAACGGDDEPAATNTATSPAATPSEAAETSAPATTAANSIAKVADVPVGGAISAQADGKKIILSRPADAEVVGFDARCPHQGCAVVPAAANLNCPCHASTFDTATGERLGGPATRGLAAFAVKIDGEDIVPG